MTERTTLFLFFVLLDFRKSDLQIDYIDYILYEEIFEVRRKKKNINITGDSELLNDSLWNNVYKATSSECLVI